MALRALSWGCSAESIRVPLALLDAGPDARRVYGLVRLRGVGPGAPLTFTLAPEAGGAPVNLANETVRRRERRGLALVGDVYESTVGSW